MNGEKAPATASDYLRFIVLSAIGVLLLLTPIRYGGEVTIGIGQGLHRFSPSLLLPAAFPNCLPFVCPHPNFA